MFPSLAFKRVDGIQRFVSLPRVVHLRLERLQEDSEKMVVWGGARRLLQSRWPCAAHPWVGGPVSSTLFFFATALI